MIFRASELIKVDDVGKDLKTPLHVTALRSSNGTYEKKIRKL
jgi:hypothetical protein